MNSGGYQSSLMMLNLVGRKYRAQRDMTDEEKIVNTLENSRK